MANEQIKKIAADILNRILKLKNEQGLSDAAFERTLGIKPKTIATWKLGISKSFMYMLPEISEILNVSVAELNGKSTPVDATASPILQIWAELDEVQRASMLRYGETLIAKDNRPKGVISEQ